MSRRSPTISCWLVFVSALLCGLYSARAKENEEVTSELFESDLQFVNGGHAASDNGVALTLDAANEIAERFGERFPIGSLSRLSASSKGLEEILIEGLRSKTHPKFSKKENILLVFGATRELKAPYCRFELIGFDNVFRQNRILTIKVLCRLEPRPKGSELGVPRGQVAAIVTSHTTKDWPPGEYECRLEFCPIDDIYLKRYLPKLRPLNEASRIGDAIKVKFELTD